MIASYKIIVATCPAKAGKRIDGIPAAENEPRRRNAKQIENRDELCGLDCKPERPIILVTVAEKRCPPHQLTISKVLLIFIDWIGEELNVTGEMY